MQKVVEHFAGRKNFRTGYGLGVRRLEKVMEFLSRFAFGIASFVLIAMSLALVGFAITELYGAAVRSWGEFGEAILGAIGYVVIALAVFDVAKYFITEEVIRVLEMRMASDERRRLTKFITIISIAVFIEGLVTVVRVSKQDVEKMFYPTLLLLTAILIVIGLGLYQRLSVPVEQQDDDSNKAKAKSRSSSHTKA